MRVDFDTTFDWGYDRSFPELARLYEVAKESQWNGATAIDWSRPVETRDPARPLLPESFVPFASLRGWRQGSPGQRAMLTHALTSWLLSQFLHGEQGALFAAAQVT
jgi:hypothetical protein